MSRYFSIPLMVLTIWFFSVIPSTVLGNDEPVGSVVAIRGEVNAVDMENFSRKLSLKSDIFREDTIITGKRGRVQIMFIDNTIISLGRNSEMNIAEYEWDPEKKDGEVKTKVKEGVFRVMGGAITKVAPHKFTTETPAATIGIRGSMYSGKVSGDSLTVVFQGGKGIDIINENGSVAITQAGYGTRVQNLLEAPTPPTKFKAVDLSDIEIELSDHFEHVNEIDELDEEEEGKKIRPKKNKRRRYKKHHLQNKEIEEEGEPDHFFHEEDMGDDGYFIDHEEWDDEWGNEEWGDIFFEDEEMEHHLHEHEEWIERPENEIEHLEGFFTGVSKSGPNKITDGRFPAQVNLTTGEFFGGGIPLITDGNNNIQVTFDLNDGRMNDDGSIEANLIPSEGNGEGRMTAGRDQYLSDAWWGAWEMDYITNGLKIEMDYSYWIIGRKTPDEFMLTNRIGRNIFGKFRGYAKATSINSHGAISALSNGETNLTINFSDHSIAGYIKFDQIVLNVLGENIFGLLTTSNNQDEHHEIGTIFANIIQPSKTTDNSENYNHAGNISGMFYSETAESLAGNFQATVNDIQYLGIFGGNMNHGYHHNPRYETEGQFLIGAPALNKPWYGATSGNIYDNYAELTLKGESINKTFSCDMPIPEQSGNNQYSGVVEYHYQTEINGENIPIPTTINMHLSYSNPSEFVLFDAKNLLDASNNLGASIMGFSGIPSTSTPDHGVYRYSCRSLTTNNTDSNYVDSRITTSINWNNRKVAGHFQIPFPTDGMEGNMPENISSDGYLPPTVFYTADIKGTKIENIHIFGSGEYFFRLNNVIKNTDAVNLPDTNLGLGNNVLSAEELLVKGIGTSGQIYGSENQAIGFTAKEFNDSTPTADSSWMMIGGGFKDESIPTSTSVSGKETWEGFITGITESKETDSNNNIATDHQILMTEKVESFTFTVDNDSGEIKDGLIAITHLDDSEFNVKNIYFGTDTDSGGGKNYRICLYRQRNVCRGNRSNNG